MDTRIYASGYQADAPLASRGAIAEGIAYPRPMADTKDRGPVFDEVRIGRPATGALIVAGYTDIASLPAELDALRALHGVGPKAVQLLRRARTEMY